MAGFRVIFEGQLQEGARPEQVKRRLATLFGLDESKLDILFRGGSARLVVNKGLDRGAAERHVAAFEEAGAVCRIEADPPLELPEEDPIRIAAEWLKAEGRSWTLAQRRVFFQSVRRYAVDGAISLLVVAGLIGLLGNAGFLRDSGVMEWTTPFGAVIRYLPDKLLREVEKLPPYVPSAKGERRADQFSGKNPENPSVVTVPFSFRGVLPLDVGESIEVDLWGTHPEADDAQFEAERVVWRGAVIEGKTSQVVSTPQEWRGRIPGIVRSYSQEGNVTRFSVTVDRKIYEQDILPTLRQRG